MSARYTSLLGLAFGDCGKGLLTDYLCRAQGAHTVVRFNGGAQAGHNVVLQDGRHHTFAQWGAGTLVSDVVTVLAQPVVIHPTALLVEAQFLAQVGVSDAFDRLLIDERCRVTTPFHQSAGRLREWARGPAAHGSCGVGVGETVRQALADPEVTLRYGDLRHPKRALEKLEHLRSSLRADHGLAWQQMQRPAGAEQERALLGNATVSARWLEQAAICLQRSPPASPARIAAQLLKDGEIVFEGAQGVLLDERHGFHPHTSWSSISTASVDAVLVDLDIHAPVRHWGVLRSYLTRHGHGPLPTCDPRLNVLPEPHNTDQGWQGPFRRGHPDAVLLDYAIAAAGPLDGLVATHLDVFQMLGELQWCTGYRLSETAPHTDAKLRGAIGAVGANPPEHRVKRVEMDAGAVVRRLLPAQSCISEPSDTLTQLLNAAVPVYEQVLRSPQAWREAVEHTAGLPVVHAAYGPRAEDVLTW